MLLGEWRKAAPNRECMSNKVIAVLKPVLEDLGADGDPACWVLWGEDPEIRYSVMAPTPAGLITVAVRVGMGDEGPRATGKLVRWGKLAVSELGVESSGGHRLVAVQIEGQVLKGMNEEADQICDFVLGLLAGIDGRAYQVAAPVVVQAAPAVVAAVKPAAEKPAAEKPAAEKPAAEKPAAEKPAAEKPAAEKPAAEKPAAEKPAAEKPAAVKPAASRARAKPGLKALPEPAAAEPDGGQMAARDAAAASPAVADEPPARKPAKTPGGKTRAAWVAPHPIGLPAPRIQAPTTHPPVQQSPAAKPMAPKQPAAPAVNPAAAATAGELGDGGPVWEVPEQTESLTRETKRPRTWTP